MKTFFHSGGDKHLVGGQTLYIEIPSLPTAEACRNLIKDVLSKDISFVQGIIGVAKHNPKDGPFKKKLENSVALQNAKESLFKIYSISYSGNNKSIILSLVNDLVRISLILTPNRKGPHIVCESL